jgi:hypothetical protein
MAYVPNYEYDVFISYARIDNEPVSGQKPWVTTFHRDLDRALKQRLGLRRGLAILFDQQGLETGHQVDALLEKARRSAVLVSIVSPAYVVPGEWTLRELEAFISSGNSHERRVFPVELIPLDGEEDYPEIFRQVNRRAFWRRKGGTSAKPLEPGQAAYGDMVQDLADEIRRQLSDMADGAAAEEPRVEESRAAGGNGGAAIGAAAIAGAGPAIGGRAAGGSGAGADQGGEEEPKGRTVLLAQVFGDELEDNRDKVRRYLGQYAEQLRLRILPEGDYPLGGADFHAALEADLEGADVFVQLLGKRPAMRPKDLPQGFDRFQADAAKARGIPRFQWISPEVDVASITDPAHLELVSGEDVRQGMLLESFNAEILKFLTAPPPVEKPPPAGKLVFINTDRSDLDLARQVYDYLVKHKWMAALPLLEGNAGDLREDLEGNLKECDALLLIYGSAPTAWVRGQLRQYTKLRAQRDRPLSVLGLYVGPPDGKGDLAMALDEKIEEIDCRAGVKLEPVEQLLNRVLQ